VKRLASGAVLYAVIAFIVVAGLSSFSFANNVSIDAVEVIGCWTSDQGDDPPDYDKNVAQCTYNITDLDANGYNDLELTIDNGYPGYQCTVNVTLHNMSAGNATVTGTTWVSSSDITIQDSTVYPIPLAANNPAGDDEGVIVFTTIIEQSAAQDTSYVIQGTVSVIGEEVTNG